MGRTTAIMASAGAALLTAACAENTAYLDRWDDPRVIQFKFNINGHCYPHYGRPAPDPDLSSAQRWSLYDGGGICSWYDAFIIVGKDSAAYQLRIASGGSFSRLNDDFSTVPPPPPPPTPGAAWRPLPSIQPEVTNYSTFEDVPARVPAIIATYLPAGLPPPEMCVWLRLSNSLTVDEVFEIQNAFRHAGVTCILTEPTLALTADGVPFPEAARP